MNLEKIGALEKIIKSKYSNTAGIIVLKEGKTCYENYFNACTATSPIHVFSVTKSIISLLIGIALDKGYINSINQKVLDFFPDYTVEKGEKRVQHIALRHLMTMTAPYKYESEPYAEYFTSDNWVKTALDLLGGEGEIGTFRYTPLIGPDILSGILVKATGQSVLDFATQYLFKPLGISIEGDVIFHSMEEQLAFLEAKNISGWVTDPTGVNTAGWGLTLTAMDMAKIGQLCLEGGIWEDEQIVSTEWIEESTKEHSKWEKVNLSYGYLWWVEDGNWYAAMGDGGNMIYINKKKQMVISIAALFIPNATDRIELIKNFIEPIFEEGLE